MKKLKTLIIVESPNKCKTIQKYLGEDYIVTACYGHCVDLAKGGKFGIGIDFKNNLKPRYVLMEEKKEVFNKLVEASEKCDQIFLASDNDREGAGIAKHLADRLESTGKPIKRITFIEITKDAIQKAILNPGEIDENLFKAQQARRILDRMVGFMVSPFLMNVYNQNLSAGRVQSVAVRLIVEREHEIKSFNPQEYWNLFANVETDLNEPFTLKYDGSVANETDCKSITASLGDFVVKSVTRKPKKEKAPPPLTTLMLQQVMAKKYGFDAERTMTAAQSCYESGLTTYIRTDSVRISDDAVKSIRSWLSDNNYPVPSKPNEFEVKETAADSHEAIRCTNVSTHPDKSTLFGDDKLLYETVWRYTVASQMEPAVFDTLEVRVSSNKHPFKASGKALSKKGYLDIIGVSKEFKIDIPNVAVGDVLTLKSAPSEQKFTQPKSRFTEANMIKELDSMQIGRPSTMATILKNILTRKYVVKNGNTYYPTDLGVMVTEELKKYFEFVNFQYSADMEKDLDLVAAGKLNYDDLMQRFYKPFAKNLKTAIQSNDKVSCDVCSAIMVERTGKNGPFIVCTGCRTFGSKINPQEPIQETVSI